MIIKTKNRTPFNYTTHLARSWKDYVVYLKRFRNNPTPILDMGCGIGLFLEACRMNNVNAIGVEFEIEGVQLAINKGLRASQHDLTQPLTFFQNETFGAVFSNQVIEHLTVNAQHNLVSEAYRVLKPGGQLLITSPCRYYKPASNDKYHINLLTPSELRSLALKYGFVKVSMGYNRCQEIKFIPKSIVTWLWKRYKPDFFSQDATILAYKPS